MTNLINNLIKVSHDMYEFHAEVLKSNLLVIFYNKKHGVIHVSYDYDVSPTIIAYDNRLGLHIISEPTQTEELEDDGYYFEDSQQSLIILEKHCY